MAQTDKPAPEQESATNTTNTTSKPNKIPHRSQTIELEMFHKAWVSRGTAIIGLLLIGVLYAFLPDTLRVGPPWLLVAIEIVLILPVASSWVTNNFLSYNLIRMLSLIVLGIATVGLAISLIQLIRTLPTITRPGDLLRPTALLWAANVLFFGLLYWEIDGGGPKARHMNGHRAADFMFPQQATNENEFENWMPLFFDYLFVAFTGATAFSPTDTYPLTRRAKALMMLEGMLSVTIVAILIGRVANIF
ncbi:MAG TPA: hypothetical protein VKV40_17895 [Ktedonobacteraceae bacterium]|nr:hypothetical protein [Ktedonobacteraceae bacterium]